MIYSLTFYAYLLYEAMTANSLSILLWIGSLVVNAIGWYIIASRQNNKEMEQRLEKIERSNKRIQGWVFGRFNVDLNGDD